MKTIRKALSLLLAALLCLSLAPGAFAASPGRRNAGYYLRKDNIIFSIGENCVEVTHAGGTERLEGYDLSGAEAEQKLSMDGTRGAGLAEKDGLQYLFYFNGRKIVEITDEGTRQNSTPFSQSRISFFTISDDGSSVFYVTEPAQKWGSSSTHTLYRFDGKESAEITVLDKGFKNIVPAPDGNSVGFTDKAGSGYLWDGNEVFPIRQDSACSFGVDMVIPGSGCRPIYAIYEVGNGRGAITVRKDIHSDPFPLTIDSFYWFHFNRDRSSILFVFGDFCYVCDNAEKPAKLSPFAEIGDFCLPDGAIHYSSQDFDCRFYGLDSFRDTVCLAAGSGYPIYIHQDLIAEDFGWLHNGYQIAAIRPDNGELLGTRDSTLYSVDNTKPSLPERRICECGGFYGASQSLERVVIGRESDGGKYQVYYHNRKTGKETVLTNAVRDGFFYGNWFYYQDEETGTWLRSDGGKPETVPIAADIGNRWNRIICSDCICFYHHEEGFLYSADGSHFVEIKDAFHYNDSLTDVFTVR